MHKCLTTYCTRNINEFVDIVKPWRRNIIKTWALTKPYLEQLSRQMQNWCSSLKRSLFTHGMPPYVHYSQPIITSKVLQEMPYSMVRLLISRFRVCVAVLTWDLFWNTSESSSVIVNARFGGSHVAPQSYVPCAFWSAALGAPRTLLKLQRTETETHTFPTERS